MFTKIKKKAHNLAECTYRYMCYAFLAIAVFIPAHYALFGVLP